MSSTIRPTNITLNRKTKQLIIDWSTDETCVYPFDQLREACPCVECRGGHENMGMEHAPADLISLKPARSYELESISMVGSYALQPFWDDKHHTGIYTWQYLYHLCPRQDTPDADNTKD